MSKSFDEIVYALCGYQVIAKRQEELLRRLLTVAQLPVQRAHRLASEQVRIDCAAASALTYYARNLLQELAPGVDLGLPQDEEQSPLLIMNGEPVT